jgi:hypothetical protein
MNKQKLGRLKTVNFRYTFELLLQSHPSTLLHSMISIPYRSFLILAQSVQIQRTLGSFVCPSTFPLCNYSMDLTDVGWGSSGSVLVHYIPYFTWTSNLILWIQVMYWYGRIPTFERPCYLHLQGEVKMEAAQSSETTVSYNTTWCYNLEDHDLNLHHYENLKFCLTWWNFIKTAYHTNNGYDTKHRSY